jgi:transcriptional/translational regulatory protein YebC/TACO1
MQLTQRAKLYSRLSRNIASAVKALGPDPASNPYLTIALAQAKRHQLPKSNIQDAISRTKKEGVVKHVVYEGLATGHAFVVEALTPNVNKTAQEVKLVFKKFGGATGATKFMFGYTGVLDLTPGSTLHTPDQMFETCLEAEVNDVTVEEDGVTAFCDAEMVYKLKTTFEGLGYGVDADLKYIPIDVTEPSVEFGKLLKVT